MQNKIYYLHALSSLHVGNGVAGGVIDMPVAREKATQLPIIPGSGIKGVLRYELSDETGEYFSPLDQKDLLTIFGPDTESENLYAGALSVADAKLLMLPVRSYKGTFAWVTCPMVLARYALDLKHSGAEKIPQLPIIETLNNALTTSETVIAESEKIYLEEMDLQSTLSAAADDWANCIAERVKGESDDQWSLDIKPRFIIIHDDVFTFLSETATEIRARIKIKENTRSVEKGGLWYEENLPAETILWGVIAMDRPRDKNKKSTDVLLKLLPQQLRLQIGGNASVGNGQTRWIIKD